MSQVFSEPKLVSKVKTFRRVFPVFCLLFIIVVASDESFAQYEMTEYVISNGGGRSGDARYDVNGTIGQAAVGRTNLTLPYFVQTGFWNFDFSPTAAGVSIEGRVVSVFGSPVGMSTVLLSDVEGNTRTAITNPFGRFRFEGVVAGRGYFIIAKAKGLSSDPRFINADQDVTGIELIAFEQ